MSEVELGLRRLWIVGPSLDELSITVHCPIEVPRFFRGASFLEYLCRIAPGRLREFMIRNQDPSFEQKRKKKR